MKSQLSMDKTAIGLSLLCLAHCLILPSAFALLPVFWSLTLEDELFHLALLVAVVPLSAFALFMGCRKHRTWSVVILGGVGLSVLISSAIFAHDLLGERGEQVGTVVGSVFIILCHYKNYQLCNKYHCEC